MYWNTSRIKFFFHLTSVFLLALVTISCASNRGDSYYKNVAIPEEESSEYVRKGDENVSLAAKYVDDNSDFLIFELHVVNGTDKVYHFSFDQLELHYTDTVGFIEQSSVSCVDKNVVLKEIDTEIANYKERKKSANTQNAIFTGMNALIAVLAGGNGLDVVATGLDGAIVGAEINSLGTRDMNSLKKYREYIHEWVLREHTVPANESANWDILFPRSNYNGPVSIKLLNKDFDVSFDFILKKQKVWR